MGDWQWRGATAPFVDHEGAEPARFVFEQVGDSTFLVERSFTYDPAGRDVTVSSDTLVQTDLASIPFFMAWFVPINGRHTPAALVHDQLVAASKSPGSAPDARADADDVFLDAMAACEVPVLRRHLMHTAVTAATRWSAGWVARIGILAWAVASLVGTVVLVRSVAGGDVVPALLAALAPLPGSLLWGRRNVAQGVIAGYAIWVVALPALACLAGYGVYWLAEQVVRAVASRGRVRRREVPRPAPFR